MRRRCLLAMVCAVVAAAVLLSGCTARRARANATKSALARAALLQSNGRHDDAIDAYLTIAQGAYTAPTRDLALAGASSALTSKIATLPVPSRMTALARFYHDTPKPLWPPGLVPYTTGVLKETAEEQLAWAELFRDDRERWLRDFTSSGSARERPVAREGVSGLNVKLLAPEQVEEISRNLPVLRQDASMAELYRILADVAKANRTYVGMTRLFADGRDPTTQQALEVGAANRLAGESVARARAILRTMP